MGIRTARFMKVATLSVTGAALLGLGLPARAQSRRPAQNPTPAQAEANDSTRAEVAQFRDFLDAHPKIAKQVRKDPALLDNRDFVKDHPALQAFFRDHAAIRNDVAQSPDAFLNQSNHSAQDFYSRDRDLKDRNLAAFHRFAGTHPEIAEQLRKDPELIKSRHFVNGYPELRSFLRQHPELYSEMRQNPKAFMQQERRFDGRIGQS